MRALLALLLASGPSFAALEARDIDRDGVADAFYDTAQDITWLADADYARTIGQGYDGLMNYPRAVSFVAGLNIGGVSGWRLPNSAYLTTPGCYIDSLDLCGYVSAAQDGELSHLWRTVLLPGHELTLNGIRNLSSVYWTGNPSGLVFMGGYLYAQTTLDCEPVGCYQFSVWPVHDGDPFAQSSPLSAIPEPAPSALMIAGLLLSGLAACRSRSPRGCSC